MRMGYRWLLMIVGLFLVPTAGFAQTSVPPVLFTGPLSGPRPESGGLYVGFSGLYMKTNRPLGYQTIAVRGFRDNDGTITGTPYAFVGSGETALSTNDVIGPGTFQTGWDMHLGWRFEGGIAVELGWRHLVEARYHHSASIIPPSYHTGALFENTFLTAPVTNFTTDWAGAQPRLPNGSIAATFGIWNAASIMEITYTQRYDIYQINARLPIWETADRRIYGLFGPRIVWIWERFGWRTVSSDILGQSGPDTTALYTNTVSNRMYGLHFGGGNEWWMGNTPIGGFSFLCDVEGGLYLNLVKTWARYARGDGLVSSGRSRRLNSLVPGAEVRLGLRWYPWEAITVELGYDIQTYFNTITSREPVDFNLGAVDPQFDHYFFRWYHGMRLGISFSF